MNNKIYGKYKTADGYFLALGTAIKQDRKDMGLSIEDVCKMTGLGKDAVLSVETGNVNTNTRYLLAVANAVGMNFCTDTEELGRRLAALRIYRGKKQSDVEQESGIARYTIVRMEHGGSTRISCFFAVCEAFGLSPIRLLRDEL